MSADWVQGGSTRRWRRRREWWTARLPVECLYCGQPVERDHAWHLSHTVARSAGGRDRDSWPAHAVCNLRAGADGAIGEPATESAAPQPAAKPQRFRIW